MKKYILILTLLISNVFFAQKFASGIRHSLIIKNDGSLWAWGDNSSGQLGTGNNTGFQTKFFPFQIGTATDWKIVTASGLNSFAIKNNGTLWAWGHGGDPITLTNSASPIQIGTSTDWKLIDAGTEHVIAIKNDGTLWSWGNNSLGQLGDGTTIHRNTPIQIGTSTDWKLVTAGANYSIAIKNDGTLWAWGNNSEGQLGDGTTIHRNIPIQIGTSTDWKLVTAGALHTVAIKNNGTLWEWGDNSFGQLGDGTRINKSIPIQIGTSIDWKFIAAGSRITKAIKNNGTIWAWGKEDLNGTVTNSPVQLGTDTNWDSLDIGFYQTLASKSDCSLMVWGYYVPNNPYAQGSSSYGNAVFVNYTEPRSLCGNAPTGQSVHVYCRNNRTIADLVVNGTGIKWYLTETGGGNPLPISTYLFGYTTLYASQTINSYESANLLAVSLIYQDTNPPTGSFYQNLCPNATIADLTLTGTEIKWYTSQSGGTPLVSTMPLVNDNIYYGSQTISGCESIGRKSVQAKITDIVAPTGSLTQTFCSGATIANLTATGTSIKWYAVATGGTTLANTTTLVNGTTYYASQTVNSCESASRLAVIVNVTNTIAPTGSATQNLEIGSALSNIVVTGTAIKWYASATGGTSLSSTTALVNDGVYYASQTLNSCESQSRFMVKVTLSSFSLPFNNFAIETKSETCASKNNGQIIITASQTKNYFTTINGKNYNFLNNGLTVPDLAPGVYTFCIGVTGKTFEQCYSVTIGKGSSITGKSSFSSNKAVVDISSGTAPFEIVVNGTPQFETNENNFSVDVKQGDLLEIKTSVACEGIYSTNILDGLIGVIIHPNPTSGLFEITIPTSKSEIEIELYSISSQLISKRKYPVNNQRVQLSLEIEPNGIYFAKLNLDSPLSLTIIKKS